MGFFSKLKKFVVDDVLGFDTPDPKLVQAQQQQAAATAAATQQALNEQTNALRAQTAIAQKSADDALAAQKAAVARSEAALIPLTDSESARKAGENRQRKLQISSPFGVGLKKNLGAADVGFRVLTGA